MQGQKSKMRLLIGVLVIHLLFSSGCGKSDGNIRLPEQEGTERASQAANAEAKTAETTAAKPAAEPVITPAPTMAEPEKPQAAVAPVNSKDTSEINSSEMTGNSDSQNTDQVKAAEENGKGMLLIEGSGVMKVLKLSKDQLKAMQDGFVEDDYFSLNNYGTKKYFHFKGISLWYLLNEKAGLKDGAAMVSFIADDGYTVEYTIEDVKRDDYIDEQNPAKRYKMLLAWEENGKEYNAEEGSPYKLVVGQKEPGDINKPNWVENLNTIRVE